MKTRTILQMLAVTLPSASVSAQITNQDDCQNATMDVVGPGVHAFDNSQATTGTVGQTEQMCCDFTGCRVDKDIWFVYQATRTGTTTIQTCNSVGTNSDTKIIAWPGTGCPTQQNTSVACNSDACGPGGILSRISFPASAGQSFLVQLGSFPNPIPFGGTGTVEILEPECFADRDDFLASCGPAAAQERFEAFAVDTPFDTGPVAIGVGTVEALNPTGFRNLVDVPPLQFGDNNGTRHASCFTNQDPPATEVRIQLSGPTRGFGAALSGATSGEIAEMAAFDGAMLLAVCAVATNDIDQFVGYSPLSGTLDRVVFRSATLTPGSGGEGFGMDGLVTCAGPPGPIGTSACDPPAPNSTGAPAFISASGSTSASAQDVTIRVDGMPAGQFGHFFASQTLGFIANPGMPPSQGNICVLGNQGRYNCGPCGQIGAGPSFELDVGGILVPTNPAPGEPILSGQTWYWQCWYRDAGNNTNFSNAVGVTFGP